MSGPFKMKGYSYPGTSPAKDKGNYSKGAQNLLKAVPNKEAYDKLSDVDKDGFDAASKKAGLPTKKSPAKAGLKHFTKANILDRTAGGGGGR